MLTFVLKMNSRKTMYTLIRKSEKLRPIFKSDKKRKLKWDANIIKQIINGNIKRDIFQQC